MSEPDPPEDDDADVGWTPEGSANAGEGEIDCGVRSNEGGEDDS